MHVYSLEVYQTQIAACRFYRYPLEKVDFMC